MDISIQGGCTLIDPVSNSWKYERDTVRGWEVYVFLAAPGEKPQIGDTIVDGVLQPKEGYIINNDPGFQAKKNHDYTWPDEFKKV